jgi:pimeloyl-ACP methyl ester carboxylesterase
MEAQVQAGLLTARQSRRGKLLRALATARTVLWMAAITYVLACASAWFWQRHLIFEPSKAMRAAPSSFKFRVEDIAIPVINDPRRLHIADRFEIFPSASAEAVPSMVHNIHGWWIPSATVPEASARTVLYLHGNDGNVSTSIDETAPLRALGYSVFMVDYSGYGRSEGPFPSERSVYNDAEAAWNYLVHSRGIASRNLFIYGHSLGGAVAIELARRHREAAGLIVESSFTSIRDMAVRDWLYGLMPVNLLLGQRFDSIDKVAQLALPVLFIHGTADETVPFEMGLQLYRKAGGNKRFVAIDGGGHENNAQAGGAVFRQAVSGFVEDAARPYQVGAASTK